MGSEPGVDAGDVEGVAALRQLADLVADGELGEADRAVGELGSQVDGEGDLREGAEDLLLEAFVRRRRGRTGR